MKRTLPVATLLLLTACSTPLGQPAPDASAAVQKLTGSGLAASMTASTADTDPNHLLGRPGQYTQRVTFAVPGVKTSDAEVQSCGRGGCIETWPDESAAQRRADYIAKIVQSLPAAVEYDTVRSDGLLLRIAGAATPAQAQAVAAAFMSG